MGVMCEKIKMHVLVTGGNRGLGFALVNVFLKEGHDVMTIVRSDSAKKMVEKNSPQCVPLLADITNYSELIELEYQKIIKLMFLLTMQVKEAVVLQLQILRLMKSKSNLWFIV